MLSLLNGSSPTNCKSKCDWLKKRILSFERKSDTQQIQNMLQKIFGFL